MRKFIKLTDCYDYTDVIVNVDEIVSFQREDTHTVCIPLNTSHGIIRVTETVEEILNMIYCDN